MLPHVIHTQFFGLQDSTPRQKSFRAGQPYSSNWQRSEKVKSMRKREEICKGLSPLLTLCYTWLSLLLLGVTRSDYQHCHLLSSVFHHLCWLDPDQPKKHVQEKVMGTEGYTYNNFFFFNIHSQLILVNTISQSLRYLSSHLHHHKSILNFTVMFHPSQLNFHISAH